jgi:hypothetical protein
MDSVSYLHTLLSFRLPSLDGTHLKDSGVEIADVQTEIGRLVPFLVDPKSTIRYTTTREAYSSIWERIGSDEVVRFIWVQLWEWKLIDSGEAEYRDPAPAP